MPGKEIMKQPEYTPAVIEFDFEAAKAALEKELEYTEGLTLEDARAMTLKDAKAARAYLNRMSKEINDARKAIKRAYTEPLQAFEGQVKELDAMIGGYETLLSQAIEEKVEAAREERHRELSQQYRDFAPVLEKQVPLDKLLDPKWLNASTTMKRATDELFDKVSALADDYATLQSMKETLEFYPEVEATFFSTCSLKEALDHEQVRKEQVAKLAELHADMGQCEPAAIPDQQPERRPEERPGHANQPQAVPEGAGDQQQETRTYLVTFACDVETKGQVLAYIASLPTENRFCVEGDADAINGMLRELEAQR